MKLYATIESERAKKGQGGKHLNIDILDENKNLIAFISVLAQSKRPTIKMYYNIELIDEPSVVGEYLSQALIMSGELKGKSQKGDEHTPANCKINNCSICQKWVEENIPF